MELGHTYYIGRSGSGKTTMMHHHIIKAINEGAGLFYLDPHGKDIDTIMSFIPRSRRSDVILLDPSQFIVPFNPLANVKNIDTEAETILFALKDIWHFSNLSTPTFDEYVLHSLVTIMQYERPTLLGVPLLLTDPQYRDQLTENLKDKHLLRFWSMYNAMSLKEQRDERRSTVNKFNTITLDTRLRRTFGTIHNTFDFDNVLEGKILLARLPQGQLGIQKTRLLGMLLLSKLLIAGLRRTHSKPFFVYVDEAHHFAGVTLQELLTGIRKYGIHVHVANQNLKQLTPEMRDVVIGNTEHRYIFRVGKADTDLLSENDETNNTVPAYHELLPHHYRYGTQSHKATPLPTPPFKDGFHKTLKAAKEGYSRSTDKIDGELDRFFALT